MKVVFTLYVDFSDAQGQLFSDAQGQQSMVGSLVSLQGFFRCSMAANSAVHGLQTHMKASWLSLLPGRMIRSYGFMPILLKLHRYFCHGLKMCMWFQYYPQIVFVTFFTNLNIQWVPCEGNSSYYFTLLSMIPYFTK